MNDGLKHITRRDFVRGSMAAAWSAAVPVGARARPAGPASSVIIVRDEQAMSARHEVNTQVLKQMLANTVMRVTGAKSESEAWRSLVRSDEVVGLVPTSHLNATHNELTQAVRTGLTDAGVPPKNIRIANGGPETAKACSALIALPALKAHWLTGIGTVLKNYILFSGEPSRYHDENNVKLGEIWNMPHVKGKTRLVVVDALRPLCDKGPQPDPRYLWIYGGLIAGRDPVAVETVCLKIITEKRRILHKGEPWPLSPPPLCVAAADQRYGLGTSSLDAIKIDRIGWNHEPLL